MKKQTLLLTALTSAFVLAGCTSQPPKNDYQSKQESKVDNAEPTVKVKAEAEIESVEKDKVQANTESEQKVVYTVNKKSHEPELIKISGIGYGAESTFEGYTPGQRRLMAIRSAKLDAYRSLAEQLYGIKIDSNTSVATLTAQNDSFRARVDALVRGARLVSITPLADHNYETILEVYVDKSFFNNTFVYTHDASKKSTISVDEFQGLGGR
ncbi:LPP20 family lipoprotein [Hydrogenovibrio sp. 3SP14C1]|uniref:LPP20 family lipoprotein n=1 Tax=Hydrogenovibrio sp. 3SP14C1 TaxID=3038774 RepID=UPI002416603D|nr:LPP20 family lipoprotein [Hydrogenovibrio sp. 3SP14C1]MDG4812918.1 LPP20 family lipoprotein [Hydrogenovibrio sp. 3SP14C1]